MSITSISPPITIRPVSPTGFDLSEVFSLGCHQSCEESQRSRLEEEVDINSVESQTNSISGKKRKRFQEEDDTRIFKKQNADKNPMEMEQKEILIKYYNNRNINNIIEFYQENRKNIIPITLFYNMCIEVINSTQINDQSAKIKLALLYLELQAENLEYSITLPMYQEFTYDEVKDIYKFSETLNNGEMESSEHIKIRISYLIDKIIENSTELNHSKESVLSAVELLFFILANESLSKLRIAYFRLIGKFLDMLKNNSLFSWKAFYYSIKASVFMLRLDVNYLSNERELCGFLYYAPQIMQKHMNFLKQNRRNLFKSEQEYQKFEEEAKVFWNKICRIITKKAKEDYNTLDVNMRKQILTFVLLEANFRTNCIKHNLGFMMNKRNFVMNRKQDLKNQMMEMERVVNHIFSFDDKMNEDVMIKNSIKQLQHNINQMKSSVVFN